MWTDGRRLFGAAVILLDLAAPERGQQVLEVVDCLLKRAAVVGLADADAVSDRSNAMEVDRISLLSRMALRLPGNGSCAVMWMPQESYTSV